MWPFKKREKEKLEQIIYDITYKVECPICKKDIIEEAHLYEAPHSKHVLTECDTCHIAIFAQEVSIKRFRKTYECGTDSKNAFGLTLTKEEEII